MTELLHIDEVGEAACRDARNAEDVKGGAIASSLVIVRSNAAVNPRFMLVYLSSPNAFAEIKKYDNGSAQPNLAGADLARFFQVPLPPLAEQIRIVEEVDRRLSVLEELETVAASNIQRAECLRQTILSKSFAKQD